MVPYPSPSGTRPWPHALALGAVLVECGAAWALAHGALATALIGHLAASLWAAGAATLGVWDRGADARRRAGLVAGSWALGMPLVGAAGVWAVLLPALRTRVAPELALRSLPLPGFEGEGSAQALAPEAEGPGLQGSPEQRIAALKRLRRMAPHHALPALRHAMNDPDEDVRLLAFAIVEQRERDLRGVIEGRRTDLRSASLPEAARARLELEVAELTFELAHAGYVSGGAAEAALQAACTHAARALHGSVSTAAQLLLARAQLALGRWEDAAVSLADAEASGACAANVAPLLAEVAYARRDLPGVRRQLGRIPALVARRPKLSALIAQWVRP